MLSSSIYIYTVNMRTAVSDTPNSTPEAARYHHGDLKSALLQAAETILKRDGVEGLTLRAAAREAGVSHAAPKNHFDDIRGLLSELAAVGYIRFSAALVAEAKAQHDALSPLDALGIGYVKFARDNAELFTLMFRSARLDFERPALRDANRAAFAILASHAGDGPKTAGLAGQASIPALTVAQSASIAAKWSLVHGFACLMLDRRLQPLLQRTEGAGDELDLLRTIMGRER
jgi:AcrR family transcriptional regulator